MTPAARDFLFRLSLALGCLHPDFLIHELSVNQVQEWSEYASREPFGFPLDDYHAALIAKTTAQVWSSRRLKMTDFMIPKPEDHDAVSDADPDERLLKQVCAAFGVKPLPKG